MTIPHLALLALSLLAASPAGPEEAAASEPTPPPADPRPSGEPPPGSADDQRLWRAVQLGTNQATFQMARVAQCAYRIRYARYYQELDARIAAPASAEAARAWRARLESAALAAEAALPKDGGRVRACRYVLLDLEAWMENAEDPRAKARLPAARAEAQACAAKMEQVTRVLTPEADRLEAVLLEVDRHLGRAPPAVPAAPGEAPPPDARPAGGSAR